MTERDKRIDELKTQRAAIDAELGTIKKQMKDEIKSAFSVPKTPKKPRQAKLNLVKA